MVYFIVNTADLTQNMIDLSKQTNVLTARKNNDGSKILLSYKDEIPVEVAILGLVSMNASEVKTALQDPEWN